MAAPSEPVAELVVINNKTGNDGSSMAIEGCITIGRCVVERVARRARRAGARGDARARAVFLLRVSLPPTRAPPAAAATRTATCASA